MNEWIPIILAAQCDDGYIHSFHVVNEYPRYRNVAWHEFYVQGYFLEMGVAHYRVTGGGDRRLYDAAVRCADQLCARFGPPPKRVWIHGHAGMGLALVLVVAGVARPSPAALGKGRPQVAGVLRITRHPVFMGIGLFGLLHLLAASVSASELAFFGGFPLFVLLGAAHQDRRKLLTAGDAFRNFHRDTAFLPLPRPAAVAAALREDRVTALIGVAAAVVVRVLHPMLFGA